jgi:hypothetical protein
MLIKLIKTYFSLQNMQSKLAKNFENKTLCQENTGLHNIRLYSILLLKFCSGKEIMHLVFISTQLILWNRDLLEKLTVAQLVNKFPTFYRTGRFITAFTRAHHWSPSWATHTLISHFFKTDFNIILPTAQRPTQSVNWPATRWMARDLIPAGIGIFFVGTTCG